MNEGLKRIMRRRDVNTQLVGLCYSLIFCMEEVGYNHIFTKELLFQAKGFVRQLEKTLNIMIPKGSIKTEEDSKLSDVMSVSIIELTKIIDQSCQIGFRMGEMEESEAEAFLVDYKLLLEKHKISLHETQE